MDFAGKHVLVLGLGETGMAIAQWLLRCGARLRVADTRATPDRLPALQQLSAELQFVGGEFTAELLDGIDVVAVSPGLSPLRELALLLPEAKQRSIPVWGEMEIFALALAALKKQRGYQPKVIAITGTNGKTTVTSMVGLLCERAGLRTRIAGNISPAVLDVLREAMDLADIQLIAAGDESPAAESADASEAIAEVPQDSGQVATQEVQEIQDTQQDLQMQAEGDVQSEEPLTVEQVELPVPDEQTQPSAQAALSAVNSDEAASTIVTFAEAEADAEVEVEAEVIDNSALPQVWVLELSSFQLHGTYSLAADAATVLNITQDHLDWHGDLAAYAADKARIFGSQTVQVLNRDDALVMAMAKPMAQTVSFGIDEPERAGDMGLINEHGMIWLATATAAEEGQPTAKRKKKTAEEIPVLMSRLMPVDALKIRGQHNATNALAALALCRAIGLNFAPLLHGLREYSGEPHRVELVARVAGVDYIDDSKGTNVGATVAALKGLGQERAGDFASKNVILIAGGEGKGQDFSPLNVVVERYAKKVLLIGKAAGEIRAAVQVSGVDLQDCTTLESAVEAAAEMAQEGDVVLLSPACASLDMFRNYAHRAQVFVDAVREIGLSKGEVF